MNQQPFGVVGVVLGDRNKLEAPSSGVGMLGSL